MKHTERIISKCKVLHLGWGHLRYVYRLGKEVLENFFLTEKDLGVLEDDKINKPAVCAYSPEG